MRSYVASIAHITPPPNSSPSPSTIPNASSILNATSIPDIGSIPNAAGDGPACKAYFLKLFQGKADGSGRGEERLGPYVEAARAVARESPNPTLRSYFEVLL